MYISRKCDFVKIKEVLSGLLMGFIASLVLTFKRLSFSKIFRAGGTKLKKINPFSPPLKLVVFILSNFFIGVGFLRLRVSHHAADLRCGGFSNSATNVARNVILGKKYEIWHMERIQWLKGQIQ